MHTCAHRHARRLAIDISDLRVIIIIRLEPLPNTVSLENTRIRLAQHAAALSTAHLALAPRIQEARYHMNERRTMRAARIEAPG